MKRRVYELAAEFGVDSKVVMDELKQMGEFVRSASSTVEPVVEKRLRESLVSMGKTHDGESGSRVEATPASVIFVPPLSSMQAVKPSGKIIHLPGLSGDAHVDSLIRACRSALESNAGSLTLDMSDATGFYPNAAVPAAAILDYSRSKGLRTAMVNSPPLLEKMSVRNPIEASPLNIAENDSLSRVWVYFDHQQANYITSAYMDTIRRRIVCEAGVLEALEWCLCEVLDNVMQHAQSGQGFVMMQLLRYSHRLAIGVADTGQGIQRSLAMSDTYKPPTAFDALTLAIEEGVTRDKTSNQGNGLFGLFRIIEQNNGTLTMRSGRGWMRLQGGRISGNNRQIALGSNNHGTFLDIQMSVDKPVSMDEALKYKHADLFLESLEDDDKGCYVVKIREHAGGAGSRAAAKELRIFLENISASAGQLVELDFSGQAVVSSSFADEVIGKLVADLGFTTFNRRYRLSNMNATVAGLIDRATAKRLGSL